MISFARRWKRRYAGTPQNKNENKIGNKNKDELQIRIIEINNWPDIKAGDDASKAELFSLNNLPQLAFMCHEKIVTMYRKHIL